MKCAVIRINPNRRRLINTSCRSTTIHWKWWAVANILESPSVKILHGESISTTHNPEQVQRRAARFVNQNYMEPTPGCMANRVQSLGWESIQHRHYINRLTMLYKIQHESRFCTKGSKRLRQLPATNDAYKFSFYPRATSDWNRLPTHITDLQSTQGFRDALTDLHLTLQV